MTDEIEEAKKRLAAYSPLAEKALSPAGLAIGPDEKIEQDGEPLPDELRIYVAIRKDLDIPRAKFGVEIAHASLSIFIRCLNERPDRAWAYYNGGMQPKIVLQVKDEAALRKLYEQAMRLGHFVEPIVDAARTVFTEPTFTCIGIGPIWHKTEGVFLKKIQLYKEPV
jgi:peptidyl-tRNA hydrolase, PTH2 family